MKNNRVALFFKHVYKHLGIYLLGFVLVPALVLSVSYFKTRVQEIEKFTLFFTTDELESEALANELSQVLDGYGLLQQYHRVSSITTQEESSYASDLATYGIGLSDFVVIPQRVISQDYLAYNTLGFKDYYEDGVSYGEGDNKVTYAIRVYNHETKIGHISDLVHYELEDEDYYLCISKNTFHYNNYKLNEKSVLLSYINWMLSR